MSLNNSIVFHILNSAASDLNKSYKLTEVQDAYGRMQNQLLVTDSLGQLTFSYTSYNNHFQITNENELAAKQLLITYIHTQKELALIQIFLWKYKQNYLLAGIELDFVFIQNYFDTNNMTKLWSNLGCLSAHMGFEVQSKSRIKGTSKNKQNLFVPEFQHNQAIKIYHCSQYESFDTIKLVDTYEINDDLQKNNTLFYCLMSRAALEYKLNGDKAHILPIILAINAINLSQNLSVSGKKVQFSKQMIVDSQQVYDTLISPKNNFVNLFHLPLHLIDIFYNSKNLQEQNPSRLIEFQQMCDISYYNKVEFMCLARNFYRDNNSVMSFSSRSGKSTTMYSLYYYDLFTKNQIPVYVNLTPNANKQPLYKRSSFDFKAEQLVKYNEQDVNVVSYFEHYYENVNDVLESIYKQSLWVQQQCFNWQKIFKSPNSFIQIFDYLIGLLTFQQQNENQAQDCLIQPKASLKQTGKKNTKQKKNDVCTKIQKNINLYVDECLSSQKKNYLQCIQEVQNQQLLFINQLNMLDDSVFDSIFNLSEEDIIYNKDTNVLTIKEQSIGSWIKILSYDQNLDNFMTINNIPTNFEIIQYFNKQKELFISQGKKYAEQKQYLLFNYWFIFYHKIIQQGKLNMHIYFIDKFIIESPQFPNIKKRKDILRHLLEQINKLSFFNFSKELENILFRFFMSLYNPRGIETMFWKTIQHYMTHSQMSDSVLTKSFSSTLAEYLGINQIDCQEKEIKIKLFNQLKIKQQSFTEKSTPRNMILVAGTDFSLINFVRQNQLCYNTESSRGSGDYIQTTIVSPAQPHPQKLDKFYYKYQRVSFTDLDQLKTQVNDSIGDLDFHQYYVHLIPEMSSEMQILCSLLSPQILFKDKDSFLLNQSQKYISNINNDTNQNNYQIYQYKQIIDQIVIKRIKKENFQQLQIQKDKVDFSCLVKNFHNKIIFVSSTIYNKEVLTFFNFQISQKFFKKKMNKKDVISAQKMFCHNNFNECNALLLFVFTLINNDNQYTFKKVVNLTCQSLFLQIFTQYGQQINQQSLYIWEQLKNKCYGMQFMVLQQSYDEFILSTEDMKNQKIKYVQQTRLQAIDSFKILSRLLPSQLKQLLIVTVIDKQQLKIDFPISDYILTIITDIDDNFDEDGIFSKKDFTIEGEIFYTYQIYLEYGIHFNKDLGKKLEGTEIISIMQLGFLQSDIILNDLFSLKSQEKQFCQTYIRKENELPQYHLLKEITEQHSKAEDLSLVNKEQYSKQLYFNYQLQYLHQKYVKEYKVTQYQQRQNIIELNQNSFYIISNIVSRLFIPPIQVFLYNINSRDYIQLDTNNLDFIELKAEILKTLKNYCLVDQIYFHNINTLIFSVDNKERLNIIDNEQLTSFIQKIMENEIQVKIFDQKLVKIYYCRTESVSLILEGLLKSYLILEIQYQKEFQQIFFSVYGFTTDKTETEFNEQASIDSIKDFLTKYTQQDNIDNNKKLDVLDLIDFFSKHQSKIILQAVSQITLKLDTIEQILQDRSKTITDSQVKIEIFNIVDLKSTVINCNPSIQSIESHLDICNCSLLFQQYDLSNDVIIFFVIEEELSDKIDNIAKHTQQSIFASHLEFCEINKNNSQYLYGIEKEFIQWPIYAETKILLFNIASRTYEYIDSNEHKFNWSILLKYLLNYKICCVKYMKNFQIIVISVEKVSSEIKLDEVSPEEYQKYVKTFIEKQLKLPPKNVQEFLQKWILNHKDTNILCTQYKKNVEQLLLKDEIQSSHFNFLFFKQNLTITDQIGKIIDEIKNCATQDIQLDIFDVILEQKQSNKTSTIAVAKLSPQEILKYLNNYIVYNYNFQRNNLTIDAIDPYRNYQQQMNIVQTQNNKLTQIKDWIFQLLRNHSDTTNTDIFNYIRNFQQILQAAEIEVAAKQENLVTHHVISQEPAAKAIKVFITNLEYIEQQANLQLFESTTVDGQIQFILNEVKKKARKQALLDGEEFNDSDLLINARKLGSRQTQVQIPINQGVSEIISKLSSKGLVIINYEYSPVSDFNHVTFICIQHEE